MAELEKDGHGIDDLVDIESLLGEAVDVLPVPHLVIVPVESHVLVALEFPVGSEVAEADGVLGLVVGGLELLVEVHLVDVLHPLLLGLEVDEVLLRLGRAHHLLGDVGGVLPDGELLQLPGLEDVRRELALHLLGEHDLVLLQVLIGGHVEQLVLLLHDPESA